MSTNKIFVVFALLFLSNLVNAQEETSEKKHSPSKATIYSAVLPGLGQAYNFKASKKGLTLLKIPIIYGVGGMLTYFASENHKEYKTYRDAINTRQELGSIPENDPFPSLTEEGQLRTRKDALRRQRDYNIIFIGVVYAVNIIDANVDAHLMEFQVNPNISGVISPTLIPTKNYTSLTAGINLSFKLNH